MWLSYKLYLITGNLSKSLNKESISAIKGQTIPHLLKWKRTDFKNLPKYACGRGICFVLCDCVSFKASKHEFISNTILSRKRKHSNYKSLDSYFQVDGKSTVSEQKDAIRI